MWVPNSESEITDACANASLEETTTFDAKREIPQKNVDLAKDVSAFANTAGGTILFGVAENDSGRPTIPLPFELKGQRERIDSVIRTSVSEVPIFRITQIESSTNAENGYLVLTIPPSERAPHMVIVKGERRFYGRGETGNYVLSEAEIARLYERRESSKSNIFPLLRERIMNCSIKDHKGFAHLHIVIKPVIASDNILEPSLDTSDNHSRALHGIIHEVMAANILGKKKWHPDFNITSSWTRRPDGYLNNIWTSANTGRDHDYALSLEANFDGSGYLFCSRAAESVKDGQKHVKLFISDLVAGNTAKFLDFFRRIYERADYFGMVDIAVGLTGLHKSVDNNAHRLGSHYSYDQENYERSVRVSAMRLQQDPNEIAAQLVMPLVKTITQNRYDPFQ